jgi:hypothetical protein
LIRIQPDKLDDVILLHDGSGWPGVADGRFIPLIFGFEIYHAIDELIACRNIRMQISRRNYLAGGGIVTAGILGFEVRSGHLEKEREVGMLEQEK